MTWPTYFMSQNEFGMSCNMPWCKGHYTRPICNPGKLVAAHQKWHLTQHAIAEPTDAYKHYQPINACELIPIPVTFC